jgi:hypothetical protein
VGASSDCLPVLPGIKPLTLRVRTSLVCTGAIWGPNRELVVNRTECSGRAFAGEVSAGADGDLVRFHHSYRTASISGSSMFVLS